MLTMAGLDCSLYAGQLLYLDGDDSSKDCSAGLPHQGSGLVGKCSVHAVH